MASYSAKDAAAAMPWLVKFAQQHVPYCRRLHLGRATVGRQVIKWCNDQQPLSETQSRNPISEARFLHSTW